MYWQGISVGLLSFLIIGLFHPLVVKAEFYIGRKAWCIFLAAGCFFVALSLLTGGFLGSALFALLGFSCLWSVKEMFEQEERVKKGWFPANPKRKGAVSIRLETPADRAAVRRIHEAAFGRVDEAFLLEKLRKAPGFVPELSLVAVKNRVAVGHILFFPASIVSHNGTETSTLALALVSVHPLFQGQGIGRRLVAEGLSAARKQVCHSVAVCGHTHFYSRFGFRKASCYGIKPPFDWSDDAFMACELQPGALSSLSGTVCYHPAFAVLSLLAVEHPQCLFHKNI